MAHDPGQRRLFVFSHPNHELAVYGLVQRLRPHLVYLTDGGGEHRVAETREGLERIGLLDQATFLDHTEGALYDALLDRDSGFYSRLAEQVRAVIERVRPAEIYCDAVEFYNPVHDMALPITRAALAPLDAVPVYELPLIYQHAADGEQYVIQRVPPSLSERARPLELLPEERDAKVAARDEVYHQLVGQLGAAACSGENGQLSREETLPARPLPVPRPPEAVLRYEWRAERLLADGQLERVITHDGHWLPVVRALQLEPADSTQR